MHTAPKVIWALLANWWHYWRNRTTRSRPPHWGEGCPEIEFLDINLTKDSSLLLYAIQSPFHWRILRKPNTGFKNTNKKNPRNKKTRVYSWIAFCSTEKWTENLNLNLVEINCVPLKRTAPLNFKWDFNRAMKYWITNFNEGQVLQEKRIVLLDYRPSCCFWLWRNYRKDFRMTK